MTFDQKHFFVDFYSRVHVSDHKIWYVHKCIFGEFLHKKLKQFVRGVFVAYGKFDKICDFV